VKHLQSALAAAVLLLLPLASAVALEAPQAVRPTWGVVVESLLDPSLEGSVSNPSINFNLGAGLVMPLVPGSRFSFEPSGDFYFAYYEYFNGRPVPTAQEDGSAFGLGLLLDAPLVYTLPLGGGFSLGLGLGLCFDLRVALTLDPNYKAGDTALMNGYFWGQGRFVTPSTILRGEYKLTERVGFGFSGRALWPVYNLWSGEGYGFFDRGMYLIDLTIVYKLGPAAP
jgi:hypothetical protein